MKFIIIMLIFLLSCVIILFWAPICLTIDIARYNYMMLNESYIPVYLKKKRLFYDYSEMFENDFSFYDFYIDKLSKKEYLMKIEKMYIVYDNYKKLGQNTKTMDYVMACNLIEYFCNHTKVSYGLCKVNGTLTSLKEKLQREMHLTFEDVMKCICDEAYADEKIRKKIMKGLLNK